MNLYPYSKRVQFVQYSDPVSYENIDNNELLLTNRNELETQVLVNNYWRSYFLSIKSNTPLKFSLNPLTIEGRLEGEDNLYYSSDYFTGRTETIKKAFISKKGIFYNYPCEFSHFNDYATQNLKIENISPFNNFKEIDDISLPKLSAYGKSFIFNEMIIIVGSQEASDENSKSIIVIKTSNGKPIETFELPLLYEVKDAIIFNINNKIYILGGKDIDNNYLSTVQSFTINEDNSISDCIIEDWVFPILISNSGVSITKDKIFIFGGVDGNNDIITNTIYCSEINSDGSLEGFKELNIQLPTEMLNLTIVQTIDKIYILNALDADLNIIKDIYFSFINSDGSLAEFKKSTLNIPFTTVNSAILTYKNKIFIFGGVEESDFTISNKCYSLSVSENGFITSWKEEFVLPDFFKGASIAANSNSFLLMGNDLFGDYSDKLYYSVSNYGWFNETNSNKAKNSELMLAESFIDNDTTSIYLLPELQVKKGLTLDEFNKSNWEYIENTTISFIDYPKVSSKFVVYAEEANNQISFANDLTGKVLYYSKENNKEVFERIELSALNSNYDYVFNKTFIDLTNFGVQNITELGNIYFETEIEKVLLVSATIIPEVPFNYIQARCVNGFRASSEEIVLIPSY